ncbi:hypothetical protein QJS10_CPB15g01400 [Acorus calamus]|uniref:Uncharacterized protein n=1 Tax=Acorus calamus TaxID=4465 RepID=A0AAV9D991_ACOCL|nr:hypothetical protein QJS10_CPB15g01400 [Acorus calamus]
MTNKGSPYSSHPSVLAVLVLLLVVAVAMTANVVVASSSRAALSGARCNGSITECHREEEDLLLVVGDLENSLQRSLLGQSNSLPYSTLDKGRQAVDSDHGQSYSQKVNPAGNRGCACYNQCRGVCGGA